MRLESRDEGAAAGHGDEVPAAAGGGDEERPLPPDDSGEWEWVEGDADAMGPTQDDEGGR
jgi:hypothetical protein